MEHHDARLMRPLDATQMEVARFALTSDVSRTDRNHLLWNTMFDTRHGIPSRVMPMPLSGHHPRTAQWHPRGERRRAVCAKPCAVLDAPGIVDNFYSDVLAADEENLFLALGDSIYARRWHDGNVRTLHAPPGAAVSSVAVNPSTHTVVAANTMGKIWFSHPLTDGAVSMVWSQSVPTRINMIRWQPESDTTMAIAAKEASVAIVDIRTRMRRVLSLPDAIQSVGIAWSPPAAPTTTLAVGVEDNCVCLWDVRRPGAPVRCNATHTSAVRALDWCPWQTRILATGGGLHDCRIRLWDTVTEDFVAEHTTGASVVALKWLPEERALAAASGDPENRVTLWKYVDGLASLREIGTTPTRTARALALVEAHETIACAFASNEVALYRADAWASATTRGRRTPSRRGTFGTWDMIR